tara:strand:- start:1051 stop:1527 length:477 start_codon:yes stop_codon:yes gene_type:complete
MHDIDTANLITLCAIYTKIKRRSENLMNDYVEHDLSTRIYNKMYNKDKEDQEVFVDPATVVLIGKISLTVVRLIKGCKDSQEERVSVLKTPTISEDRLLARVVRRKLGWFKYMRMGGKVVKAMKEMGADLAPDEMERAGLFNEEGKITVHEGEKYQEL